MLKRSYYIVILTVLFLIVAKALNWSGFWEFSGLGHPHGFVAQGLIFIGLLLVLQNGLFDPYLQALQEREDQTINKKKRAEESRQDADSMIERYRQAIEAARIKATREREQRALQAEKEEREILKLAKEQSGRLYDTAVAEYENEAQAAQAELSQSVGLLAEEISDQVLGAKKQSGLGGPKRAAGGGLSLVGK